MRNHTWHGGLFPNFLVTRRFESLKPSLGIHELFLKFSGLWLTIVLFLLSRNHTWHGGLFPNFFVTRRFESLKPSLCIHELFLKFSGLWLTIVLFLLSRFLVLRTVESKRKRNPRFGQSLEKLSHGWLWFGIGVCLSVLSNAICINFSAGLKPALSYRNLQELLAWVANGEYRFVLAESVLPPAGAAALESVLERNPPLWVKDVPALFNVLLSDTAHTRPKHIAIASDIYEYGLGTRQDCRFQTLPSPGLDLSVAFYTNLRPPLSPINRELQDLDRDRFLVKYFPPRKNCTGGPSEADKFHLTIGELSALWWLLMGALGTAFGALAIEFAVKPLWYKLKEYRRSYAVNFY